MATEGLRRQAVSLRPFRGGDAERLASVMFQAVRVGAIDYDEPQRRAWLPTPPTAEQLLWWAADGRTMIVAVAERPVGWIDLLPIGHIDHLFCHPAWTGRGIGSRLIAAAEEQASAAGLRRLTVDASETARRVFAARGYRIRYRRTQHRGGVALHNYAMSLDLTA